MRGTTQGGRESVNFEVFRTIFHQVLQEVGGKNESETGKKGDWSIADMLLPRMLKPVYVNLEELHLKFLSDGVASVELWHRRIRDFFEDVISPLKDAKIPSAPPPELYLSINKSNFFEDSTRKMGLQDDLLNDQDKALGTRFIVQRFSSRSGELTKGLVISASSTSDLWIPKPFLTHWGITEARAFELAVQNIDRITPSPFNCNHASIFKGKPIEWRASKKRIDEKPFEVCCMRNKQGVPVYNWLSFKDRRAPPRLILLRVIESFAEELGCSPTSILVVPFSMQEVYAGNCESNASMFWLARQVHASTQGQVDNIEDGDYVSPTPYRVTMLRNEQGLVSLEPYPLVGGSVGLVSWEGSTRKLMWPFPKTEAELDAQWVPDAKKGDKPKPPPHFNFIEESDFFADYCWNCRKKGDRLMKCGKCLDVKYCSKECQKVSWREGHKFDCDAWKQTPRAQMYASMAAPPKMKKVQTVGGKHASREVRKMKRELTETVSKNDE